MQGRELEEQKQEKLLGQDKDILICKGKLHAQGMQNKEFIHYFPLAGRFLAMS